MMQNPGLARTGMWLAICACAVACNSAAGLASGAVESLYTEISAAACTERIDEDDPNEIPYRVCPGVQGYSLVDRRVGSGRRSLDLRTPSGEDHPLELQEVVTRHMAELGEQIEWRTVPSPGGKTPIALIIRVRAHEDHMEPAEVTSTYVAVAKIASDEACVVARMDANVATPMAIRRVADTATEKPCLDPLPELAQ